jgi:hypothetical protein
VNTSKTESFFDQLSEMIPVGSKVRIVCSLSSMYSCAETQMQINIKAERVQVLEAGTDVAEVENYPFDN